MGYLISQMLLCLLLAALLGFLIGWLLRAMTCNRKIAEIESSWTARLAALEAVDDLKKIEGIGPKIATLLNDNGIRTWAKLADTPVEALQAILRKAGDRFKMNDPSSWPDQARLAAEGRWQELDELQDILLGGREK
jgi:nucleotidyltransferase/DNA polymerase involved in DNA repair